MSTSLVALRPRFDTRYVSRNRTVLAVGENGFIEGSGEVGLFVHETRLVSRLRYLVDGTAPRPVALSNVEQHSWLGYYVHLPPGGEEPRNSRHALELASQHSLELRLARVVGDGMHEDVELTNFSGRPTSFRLELDVRADFADLHEVGGERKQRGRLERRWRHVDGGGELHFDYRVRHAYAHQGDRGTATLERGVMIRVLGATSPPRWSPTRIAFDVALEPLARWRTCVLYVPRIDGHELGVPSACCTFASPSGHGETNGAGQDDATAHVRSDRLARPASTFVAPIYLNQYIVARYGWRWLPALSPYRMIAFGPMPTKVWRSWSYRQIMRVNPSVPIASVYLNDALM